MSWRFLRVQSILFGVALLGLPSCAEPQPDLGATVGDGAPLGVVSTGDANERALLAPLDTLLYGEDTEGRGGSNGLASACTPTSCEQLGKDCGTVPDGCGGALECGRCPVGSACGLVAAQTCTPLSTLCVPATRAEACEGKECGVEGDGCGGTMVCGECSDNERCGVVEPFRCAGPPIGNDNDCPARIESCEAAGAECGLIGNGCGGTLNCGSCGTGESCGVVAPSQCDAVPACVPSDPVAACAGHCGLVSNGCGVSIDSGATDCDALSPCPNAERCGGSGIANQCGSGGAACPSISATVACAGRECGVAGDGCGGVHECGSCASGERCEAGACVSPPVCTPQPRAVACAGRTCGLAGDGCGGTVSCGTCSAYQQCGAEEAFQCGASGNCQPLTAAQACAGKECGAVFDGCGTTAEHRFDCAAQSGRDGCPAGEVCGVRAPFQCDVPKQPACTPNGASCAALGWQCGVAINNCGQAFDCASEGRVCSALSTCVGGIDGPTACVGDTDDCPLCPSVPSCAPQTPTRLVGRVLTPGRSAADTGNQVGVPNAFVYILQSAQTADLPPVETGIPSGGTACDRCTEQELGPVLASAVTDSTGRYVLEGSIPVGQDFLLVTKAGKFRRVVSLQLSPSVACTTVQLAETLPDNPTRLPRSMSDGLAVNIPRVAVSTGRIDAMECVFEKMGLAHSEFGNPGSAARLHLHRGGPTTASAAGAVIDAATPHDTGLYGALANLQGYDLVVADCEGTDWDGEQRVTQRDALGPNVREYVNRGGRLFASHLSFSWLHENGSTPFSPATPIATGLSAAATWDLDYLDSDNLSTRGIGQVSVGRAAASPRIQPFLEWVLSEGIVQPGAAPQFSITDPRSLARTLGPNSEEFVFRTDGNRRVQQFSFDTPYGATAEQSCGRVAYSGFHVAATGGSSGPFANAVFPEHCQGDLTDQEKVLLYMLFDLGACVGGSPEPAPCVQRSCPQDGSCGLIPDGCGGQLECSCGAGEACVRNACVGCQPRSCSEANAECGLIGDGCTAALYCGSCDEGKVCGAPDPNRCGTGPECTPLTCDAAGAECGVIGDGCGDSVDCGPCPKGQLCGVERSFRCDPAPACTPATCSSAAAECGLLGDGCGAVLDCGECPEGAVCGLGADNRCLAVR